MSPIIGLTDNVRPAFPVLGKLHKGEPKTSPNAPGKDTDCFRFATDRPDVAVAFRKEYGGDTVATLAAFLPYQSLPDNFDAWREEWTTVLQHRCDGEQMVLWLDKTTGSYRTDPKPCADPKRQCKPVGRLTLILPGLLKAGFVGYVVLETHSVHDIRSIQAALQAVADSRASDARGLRGIEFTIRRQTIMISTPKAPGSTERVRRAKSLVKIEPSAAWVSLQISLAQQDAVPQIAAPIRAMIDTPAEYQADAITGEVIEDEDEDAETKEAVVAAIVGPGQAVAVAQPVPAPAPKSNGAHWSKDPNTHRRFHAKVGEMLKAAGLVAQYELWRKNALGVDHLTDYTGAEEEAVARVGKWIEAQVN